MKTVNVEIITIGDELLLGQVVDTNSAWMGEKLNEAGFSLVQISSISDERSHILSALDLASKRAEVVLITGGLGPTKDDITKGVLCEYFNDELKFSAEVFEQVKGLFAALNVPMPEVNRGQAELPSRSIALANAKGTAPGMWFEEKGKIFVSMPGVPYEMKYLMQEEVLPRLSKKFETPDLVHRTVLTHGIGESSLMEHLNEWENDLLASGLSLAWLPSAGMVRLRLSAKGNSREQLELKIQHEIDKLQTIIPEYFLGADQRRLEQVVGDLLKEKEWTLSTAESCTGGLVAHLITSVPGSSAYFEGAVVSYSNRIKETSLKVSWESLKNHGAVSKQVVEEMANGVRRELSSDCSIATSGIAGPDGGSDEKPVGTVWIAVSTPQGTVSELFHFGTDRIKNIKRAANSALRMLQKEILKHS